MNNILAISNDTAITVLDLLAIIPLLLIMSLLILRVFFVYRAFLMSYILIFVSLSVFIFQSLFPPIFSLPLNTFEISYHPTDRKNKALELDSYRGDSVSFEGFANTKIHKDKKDNFSIKMEGVFYFNEAQSRTFHFNYTWAKAELIIDDKLINDKISTGSINHKFTAGFHHIKIIMYNDSTVFTKMSAKFSAYEPILTQQDITQKLKGYFSKDINIYYTYAWNEKSYYLEKSDKPTFVFINVRQSPKLMFNNAKEANLKAIIYTGVGPKIQTDFDEVKLYRIEKLPELSDISLDISQCKEQIGMLYNCPGSPTALKRLNVKVQTIIGRYITGFTKASKFLVLNLPEMHLDVQRYKEIKTLKDQIENKKTAIKNRKANPFYANNKNENWSSIFKVKDIPTGSYKAYYMDSRKPNKLVYSENVDNISLNFDRKGFHGIKAEYLAALWVGDFNFKVDTHKELSVSLSWAKVNIIIDGKSIYKQANSKTIPYTFTKGKHRVEIEFNSNYWHVGFLFSMNDVVNKVQENTFDEISDQTKVYLLGVYASRREDHGFDVKIEDRSERSILLLSSYEAVKWNIKNAKNVEYVIYHSSNPGTSVISDNKNLKIYQDKELPYVARILPYCYDIPRVHCESKNAFSNAVKYSQKRFGKRPDGFSSIEVPAFKVKRLKRLDNTRPILVPQMLLKPDTYAKVREKMKKYN